MSDKKDASREYGLIDLHNHSIMSFEPPKATMPVEDMLEYYELMGEVTGKKVSFAITDHDSSLGALKAVKTIAQNPKKYFMLDFIPGMELNVSLNKVFTYTDPRYGDKKYLFKSCHMLVHAKRGREEEFLRRTHTFSVLSHMEIKKPANSNDPSKMVYKRGVHCRAENDVSNFLPVGKQILAARNLLCQKYDIYIPYDIYKPCLADGLTYNQMRNIFVEESAKFLSSKCPALYGRDEKILGNMISKEIAGRRSPINPSLHSSIFPTNPFDGFNLEGLARIDIRDIRKMVGDSATLCYAHPHTISLHKDTAIPVKLFKNIDISSLPEDVQKQITDKLNDPVEFESGYFSKADIMGTFGKREGIIGDRSGIVKFQLLDELVKMQGIKVEGFEFVPKYVKGDMEHILDVVMDRCNLAVDYGTDKHYNQKDESYINKNPNPNNTYFDDYNAYVIESPYHKLNRLGKLDTEENSFSIRVTR
ncbi:MAG TPA: hypothetical protein DCZ34_02695 [Clostridiales bacterium]|nr:hypothetical protein [Clostridiales bacterium]